MQQKHYMDIERLKPAFADGFEKGDFIVIQEKIDGANFSIRYDPETDTVKAFSRKTELNEMNNLRGAWEWSQSLDKELVKSVLGTNLILFAEWLVPHSVKYPEECYKKAYCYDVYNTDTSTYQTQDFTEDIIKRLGLIYVPTFFRGEFTSWDEVKKYIGRTELGGEYGEGIVVKNQTKLNNPNTRLPFYTKLVGEKFCETKAHKVKVVDTEALAERERKQEIVGSVVTKARVAKLINKMVDEGILREDWDAHDMGTIAKNLGKAVYYDCLKEEPDVVASVDDGFGKFAASIAMRIAREILSDREAV